MLCSYTLIPLSCKTSLFLCSIWSKSFFYQSVFSVLKWCQRQRGTELPDFLAYLTSDFTLGKLCSAFFFFLVCLLFSSSLFHKTLKQNKVELHRAFAFQLKKPKLIHNAGLFEVYSTIAQTGICCFLFCFFLGKNTVFWWLVK